MTNEKTKLKMTAETFCLVEEENCSNYAHFAEKKAGQSEDRFC